MFWAMALFVWLGAGFSDGQQNSPSVPPSQADAQPDRVKVYAVGQGITAPELLPVNQAPISGEKCKKKEEGKVVLSILVDTAGRPRNLMFLQPLGTDLDKLALDVVAADRFKPGTYDGEPVVVAQSVEVSMQVCVEEKKDDAGKKIDQRWLKSQPEQKLGRLQHQPEMAVLTAGNHSWKDFSRDVSRAGSGATAPVPLNRPMVNYMEEAAHTEYQGAGIVSVIVNENGMPQDMRVLLPLKHGLTEKAIEAAGKYRFKPATLNGRPIPARINIVINLHLMN